jgi:heptaprenyl diphosphate synthase
VKKTKKLATLSLAVALAMVLSFVESQIPAFVAIPGVKIGLANIAVIFTLYKLGWKEAVAVSLVRVALVALLFGSFVSMLYSICGAVLSLAVMIILKSLRSVGKIAVSVCGGVCHNVGQIIMASLIMETNVIIYYLPFLLLSGTIAGIAIGLAAALIISRVKL